MMTGIKSTKDNSEIEVRTDMTDREIGIIAGKNAVYLDVRELGRLMAALKETAAKSPKTEEDDGESLKSQMTKHLRTKFKPLLGSEMDDFDIEAAIYWFAHDFHSGQSSDLYSLLSTSEFRPGPSHRSAEDEGDVAKDMYDELVNEFAPKRVQTHKAYVAEESGLSQINALLLQLGKAPR